MRDIVRNSASAPAVDVALPVDPFRLDPECREKPTSFETNFVRDGVRYQYGFSATREKIFEEWLYAYPRGRRQVWFERMGSDGWHFGPHLTGERERIRRLTRPDALYLSTAAALNHEQLTRVYKWLASIDVRSVERRGLPFFLLQREEERTRDPAMRHRVLTLLRAADVGIADFRFDKAREDGDGIERLAARMGATRVRTLHQAKDGPVWLDLRNDESLGTQELFFIAVPLLAALEEGTLLVIDEVLSALHPNLIRLLVDLVHRSERGQLLMATHETSLLDSRLMRRDQIYFVEKDANGASHLYSLLEFKPRKDEAFARGYLSGRYGAIPFLGTFEFE